MKKICMRAVLFSFLMSSTAFCLTRSDLSAEAKKLTASRDLVVVVLNNGKSVTGTVVRDTPEKLTLRIRRSGTISSSRSFLKTAIQSVNPVDITNAFAEKLSEINLSRQRNLSEEEYEGAISLFDEFLAKCKGASQRESIKLRRDAFAYELAKVQAGMRKVGGKWMTPVRAAVKEFELLTEQIEKLRKRRDFKTNKKVQGTYERLMEERRGVARTLPKLMQDRVPLLIKDREFDEAIAETTAFLQFFVDQVVVSEGPAARIIGEMDFDFILRMEDRIMEAYREAGLGAERPADVKEPDNMVYIPGGYFVMGRHSTDSRNSDFPMRIIFVSPFLIDKYEVSNAEYRKFVDHVKETGESWMEHPEAPPLKRHDADGWGKPALNRSGQPVVGVDWLDAYAYAKWVLGKEASDAGESKRLPTEAEWEKAARGIDGRKYPWGNDFSGAVINCAAGRKFLAKEMDRQNPPKAPEPEPAFGCTCVEEKEQPTVPPTRLPEETWDVDKPLPRETLQAIREEAFEWTNAFVSAYGILHMSGNAAEWVGDWYDAEYYHESPIENPQGPEKGTGHTFRGGSYLSTDKGELTAYWRRWARNDLLRDGRSEKRAPMIGLRCAKSIEIVKEVEEEPELNYDELMEKLEPKKEEPKRKKPPALKKEPKLEGTRKGRGLIEKGSSLK